jgi:hypothetical protein
MSWQPKDSVALVDGINDQRRELEQRLIDEVRLRRHG